ncbi:hypothetical protein BVRB_035450 [Beta vulgaris subsp. vulgaris]|uniref:Uncharacterized protein n=1 Tax=Beta vulgaris subsp. vulgaris TaxID=3555 RepID=A0A0J7YPM9_BETVV|nr:hypothetical protein BVRB_035450 [Beta vulgaris subsp. vulgaris]
MGEYVMQFLSSHQRENAAITASELALDLAKTFPAFNDKPFYSKACGLLCTLYWSFKDRIPPMRFRHMSKLCPESDAEMVDFFYDRGVIELEGDADKVPIAVLRSAVVVAVRQLQMNLQSSRQLSLSVVELNSILHEMHRSDVKAASRDGSPPDRPYCIPPSFYL